MLEGPINNIMLLLLHKFENLRDFPVDEGALAALITKRRQLYLLPRHYGGGICQLRVESQNVVCGRTVLEGDGIKGVAHLKLVQATRGDAVGRGE
jgi:hypothetical protein